MKYWLDALLGRLTMYRVVVYSLLAVYLTGLTLAVTGGLPFTPKAMLVSAGVLIVTTYISNRVFAWLYGVRPHGESSLITALILFFLFVPVSEPTALVNIVFVAMIASASKYLLAFRGRHIFNPVAVAAVVGELSGFSFATWWVATPVLLPVTLVAAAVILYKTRRLMLGSVFMLVAVSLIITHAQLGGRSLSAAIISLSSWPLIFFVGFMLSEPLTLPPRRWQQTLVSIVVAILFALAPHFGTLAVTPPIALLFGNALAFLFGQRRHIGLAYAGRRQLTPSTQELVFTSDTPHRFTAGQYIELSMPHRGQDGRGARRIFSLASAPDDDEIRFGIKIPETPSSFKQQLLRLAPGDILSATGVGGDFLLPRTSRTPLLFVAGGIGITPFISHLKAIHSSAVPRDVILVYAVSSEAEIAYRKEIVTTGVPVLLVCREPIMALPPHWRQVTTNVLTPEALQLAGVPNDRRYAFVSGPPPMVEVAKRSLRQLGVRHIKTDYFTGY
jgi:ferredoxin-NADP reductase